jgi:hypothetical protein
VPQQTCPEHSCHPRQHNQLTAAPRTALLLTCSRLCKWLHRHRHRHRLAHTAQGSTHAVTSGCRNAYVHLAPGRMPAAVLLNRRRQELRAAPAWHAVPALPVRGCMLCAAGFCVQSVRLHTSPIVTRPQPQQCAPNTACRTLWPGWLLQLTGCAPPLQRTTASRESAACRLQVTGPTTSTAAPRAEPARLSPEAAASAWDWTLQML